MYGRSISIRALCSKPSQLLSAEDWEIVRRHQEACESELSFYEDPQSGLFVMTSFHHSKRKKCCGSACRHCPHGQVNVKKESKKKVFNGYFYQ